MQFFFLYLYFKFSSLFLFTVHFTLLYFYCYRGANSWAKLLLYVHLWIYLSLIHEILKCSGYEHPGGNNTSYSRSPFCLTSSIWYYLIIYFHAWWSRTLLPSGNFETELQEIVTAAYKKLALVKVMADFYSSSVTCLDRLIDIAADI